MERHNVGRLFHLPAVQQSINKSRRQFCLRIKTMHSTAKQKPKTLQSDWLKGDVKSKLNANKELRILFITPI